MGALGSYIFFKWDRTTPRTKKKCTPFEDHAKPTRFVHRPKFSRLTRPQPHNPSRL